MSFENGKNLINTIIGLLLFGVSSFCFSIMSFNISAALTLGLLIIMVYWWITRPIHLAVTALLPILLASLYPIAPINDVLSYYFSPIAVLLIGTGILIAALKKTGVSTRVALKTLTILGTGVKKQLLVWFLFSLILSMFLPNAVVAAMLLPIAESMIEYTKTEGQSGSDEAKNLIFIAIVWGAGLGGFGTPLGGAMNLVAINHIEALTGKELLYIDWTAKVMPYLLLLAAGTVAVQLLIRTREKRLAGSHTYFIKSYEQLSKIKREEWMALILFLAAVILAFARPLYASVLPEFKPYYAFLLMGLLAFFISGRKKRLITFSEAVKEINWGMIFLFSGGLAIGKLILSTGAAEAIASVVVNTNVSSTLLIGFLCIILAMFLSNASSNTAAVSVMLPIVITIFGVYTLQPLQIPIIFIVVAGCNAAFILPTSIRAISLGYGLSTSVLAKNGLIAALVSAGLLTLALWIRLGTL